MKLNQTNLFLITFKKCLEIIFPIFLPFFRIIHGFLFYSSVAVNMASQASAESLEPATKRQKTREIELDSGSKVSQNQIELELKTSQTSKNHSGSFLHEFLGPRQIFPLFTT